MSKQFSSENIARLNAEILVKCGVDLKECYQCGKCSAGCSSNWMMDYRPHVIMRLAQLGQRAAILASQAIWVCTGCEICSARCPRGIDVAAVVDSFRQLAVAEDVRYGEHDIPLFHQYFLKETRDHGRVRELPLVANFKIHSEHPLSDFALGPTLLAKGKIKLVDDAKGSGVNDLQELFKLKV